jgi:ESF2/ABP1 family protein
LILVFRTRSFAGAKVRHFHCSSIHTSQFISYLVMATKRNDFLDAGFSDESDHEDGYDSEAAELSKGQVSGRPAKRLRLSSEQEDDALSGEDTRFINEDAEGTSEDEEVEHTEVGEARPRDKGQQHITSRHSEPSFSLPLSRKPPAEERKKKTPGVIYLSSLPPYLRPSALRNLLSQRGFEPITRLFLTPASKAKSTSKKNSRQLYTEGWIEFASKKTARRCAEALNASPVGGKKGGFYHDDVWNMKYLKGMGWAELMSGVREERREEEGRRDEERRTIARETKGFLEGVEEGKRQDGMKRKRAGKTKNATDGPVDEVKRTWRQFESKGTGNTQSIPKSAVDETAKRVLGKIF